MGISKSGRSRLRELFITKCKLQVKRGFTKVVVVNKYLMTGPKANSEFCFPVTLNVPLGEAEGNIEIEGKQNSLFPAGPVIDCFVIPPNAIVKRDIIQPN